MKSAIYAVLCAALTVSAADAASAQIVGMSDRNYASHQEAARNLPPLPDECRGQGRINTCVAVQVAEDGPEGLLWRPGWALPEGTYCVDGASADFEVDCDAVGAVRVPPPPSLCIVGPGGVEQCREVGRPPRREP